VLIFNGPSAKIYGIDGQGAWKPTEHLTLRAGAAWLHARYGSFPNATGTGLDAATQTLVSNQSQDWTHQQLPRAPNFSGFIGGDLDVPLPYGGLLISVNVPFTASYVVNNPSLYGPLAGSLANKQRYRQKGYTLVNGTITWTDPTEHYAISGFVRNLTNKKYFILYSSSGVLGDYGITANPRVFGARVEYKF
jgi:iron complex outermembrane receptor protein